LCCLVSVLVIVGVWQGPLLLALWFGYLSMAVTGDVFMGFQWDALLLEAGLLGIFIAPWQLWASPQNATARDAPRVAIWLLHWLLFRLMFLSGLVKLAGGDATWQNLTALLHHYETQPLPNPLSWYFHHQPRWLHVTGCAIMFFIEIALPFAIFTGRIGRCLAAAGFTLLMALVFLSGNYNFFNLLTLVLSLTLLDDRSWPRWIRQRATLGRSACQLPSATADLAGVAQPDLCAALFAAYPHRRG
jgi:lipase maturation factor 1